MSQPSAPTEAEMLKSMASDRSSGRDRHANFAVGDVIGGRYELRRDIGRGAGGIVFEAEHTFTRRRVAVKLVSPDAPWSTVGELRARLIREARALAAVRHPGIVDILDGGVAEDGTPYIVLEMLEGGRTLEGLLATRQKISKKDTVGIILQLCDALGVAHEANIVHRDLKPGNIIIVRDNLGFERVKLVDFGIAQMPRPREPKLTTIGSVIGTPEYMAPEQLLGSEVDHRADVYALGITMFECLSGRVPYVGIYQQVLLQALSDERPPALLSHCPDAGSELATVVDRAISKDPADRYSSVAALARAILEAVPSARRLTTLFGPPPVPTPVPSEEQRPTALEQATQRRKAARAAYVTPVHVTLANGSVFEGRTEDISEGGLLVICRGDCAPQQRATVRFALPMEGTIVSCTAELRWVRVARPSDPDGPRALGLEFVDPSPALRASVMRYVGLMTR